MPNLSIGLAQTLVTLALAVTPGVVLAGPCGDAAQEAVVSIEIPPGQQCWTYKGNAISFSGPFAQGQTVEARMSGEAAESGPDDKIVTYQANRNPNVQGPDDFYAESSDDSGALTFRVPKNGRYLFEYGPRAMLCSNGEVTVCAK